MAVGPAPIGTATVPSMRPGVFNLPSKSAEIPLISALGERLESPAPARGARSAHALGAPEKPECRSA